MIKGGLPVKNTYANKRNIAGFLFVLPWIIGLLLFFIQPLVLLFRLAFTNMVFDETSGYILEPLGSLFENFKYIFTKDAYFSTYLFGSLGNLLYEVPFIILFSLFSAVILNQKFHGRTAFRVIFFLPVVIGCGLIMNVIQATTDQVTMTAQDETSLFNVTGLVDMLLMTGLPEQLVSIITTLVTNVADLVWKSAIQILVFLVALLSIPQSHYEVAKVEGAKAWETFWKVTFPTVTPYVLALTVYTIIDSFTNVDNKVLKYIVSVSNTQIKYSRAAAMSWIFFVLILLIVLIVFIAFKPFVFQRNAVEKEKRKVKK